MMQVWILEDPFDRSIPFVNEWDDPETILYHGTSSAYTTSIERDGLQGIPFKKMCSEAIAWIVTACNTFHILPAGWDAAKGYADHGDIYFARKFLRARDYASNLGGERVNGAIKAGKEFCAILHDEAAVDQRIQHWVDELRKHGRSHSPTERILANLRDITLRKEQLQIAQNGVAHLESIFAEVYPIVYAVRVENEQLSALGMASSGGYHLPEVPADMILGRVDYINGIDLDSY